jgi:pimeloyl-ACP methyl ester carboxylesterase
MARPRLISKYIAAASIALLYIACASQHAHIACASQHADAVDRPIVLIPGILGSELSDANGKVIWGDALSLSRLSQLTIPNGPADPRDGLRPTALITQVQIFGPLKIKEYSSLRDFLKTLGYVPGVTYFEFPYDWRQSNYSTARRFADFVEKTPNLKNGHFDIIAHSMGGLVAEIYVKQLDTGHRVERVINMGVPFLGSVDAFSTVVDGWGSIGNVISGGMDKIRAFAFSIPSFYELLPRYPNCCINGLPGRARVPYDPTTLDGWNQILWDPRYFGNNQEGLSAVLSKAASLRDLSLAPYPSQIQDFYIVGSGIDTPWQFYVNPSEKSIETFTLGTGDGTVAEGSAANQNIEHSFVSLHKHETIFDDGAAKVTLRRILLHDQLPDHYRDTALSVLTTDHIVVPISSVGISVQPSVVAPGGNVNVKITLTGPPEARLDAVDITAVAVDSAGRSQVVGFKADVYNHIVLSQGDYVGHLSAGPALAATTIRVSVPGLSEIQDYFAVLGSK